LFPPVPVSPLALLVEEGAAGAVVDAPLVATGPTAIVVVDVGRLGSNSSTLPSQVSINAAMAPSYAAKQSLLSFAPW
jgi:hypothetical protein